MKAVVDTSWLYALLNGNDAHHDKARAELSAHEQLYVAPAVLIETLGLIHFRQGRKRTRDAVDLLASTGNVSLGNPPHDHDATMRIWDAHTALSYVDAAAISAARRSGLELRTFDKDQAKAHRSGRP